MKVFLMYRDRDFDLEQPLPPHGQALTQDLGLEVLFHSMAQGDAFLLEVARKAVLSGENHDLDTILFRQHVLQDCLRHPTIVRDIYALTLEIIESERKKYWGILSRSPSTLLRRSIEVLQMFVGMLRQLRKTADAYADDFESDGFARFFRMLQDELTDEYFATIQRHLRQMKFGGGVLVSAELGEGNRGRNYILRTSAPRQRGIREFFAPRSPTYSLEIAPRDQSGMKALMELEDRGLNQIANALAQSNDHILSFIRVLRTELAFYIGCMNLHEQLMRLGAAVSFPDAMAPGSRRHSARGIYDVCLALTLKHPIVANDVNADHRDLVVITGANQGGKSTFLRAVGVSQLMMQCGMFVPADSFQATVYDRLFTHFKREEDITMKSGKLDEELSRMSAIVDLLTPNSILLLNESFSATNEREGSEIARQIVTALVAQRVKVFFVTHLYEFAYGFYKRGLDNTLFLRGQRHSDGTRPFRMLEGEPLQTSFGEDLYHRIFATSD